MGVNHKPLLSPLTFSLVWGHLLFLPVSRINDVKGTRVPQLPGMFCVLSELLTDDSFGYFSKCCSGHPLWRCWQAKHGSAFHSSRWVCAAWSLHRFSVQMRRPLVTPLHGAHAGDLRCSWGMVRLCSKLRLPWNSCRDLAERKTWWGSPTAVET